MFSVIIQYILKLVAFFDFKSKRVELIFESIACLFIFGFFFYKAREGIDNNNGDSMNRAFNGVVIFFQIFRYLKRKSYLT